MGYGITYEMVLAPREHVKKVYRSYVLECIVKMNVFRLSECVKN